VLKGEISQGTTGTVFVAMLDNDGPVAVKIAFGSESVAHLYQEHDIYCHVSAVGGLITECTTTVNGLFKKWFEDSQITVLVMDLVGSQAASEVDEDIL